MNKKTFWVTVAFIAIVAVGIIIWQCFGVSGGELGLEQEGTGETSSELFEGRLSHAIISMEPLEWVFLLSNLETVYSLTGPKAEELMNSFRASPDSPPQYSPWDVKVWGEEQEPVEIFEIDIPVVYVTGYEVPKEGWIKGVLYSYKSCSYNVCNPQLMLNKEGGGKYNIVGELRDELLSIVGEGGYEEKHVEIELYGEFRVYTFSSAIDVEEYRIISEY